MAARRSGKPWLATVAIAAAGCGASTPHGAATTTLVPTTSRPVASTTTTPTRFAVQSASFVSADVAYVLGASPCPAGTCASIRTTTDRGTTWHAHPAPVQGLTDQLHIFFADANNGWVWGPGLWATHDGGEHWTKSGYGVYAMGAGDGTVFMLASPCTTGTSCSLSASLYRSPAGAENWAQVGGASSVAPRSGGLAVVGPVVLSIAEAAGQTSPTVQRAADGTHFSDLPDPCPKNSGSGVPYTPAAVTGWGSDVVGLLCAGGVGAGNQERAVYLSTDAGQMFTALGDTGTGGDVGELAMAGAATVLMSAQSGATFLFRLTSAGTVTQPIEFGDGGVGISDLSMSDPLHGDLVYGNVRLAGAQQGAAPQGGVPPPGSLLLTEDGGASWHPVSIPG